MKVIIDPVFVGHQQGGMINVFTAKRPSQFVQDRVDGVFIIQLEYLRGFGRGRDVSRAGHHVSPDKVQRFFDIARKTGPCRKD